MKFIRKSIVLVIAAFVAAVLGFVSPVSAGNGHGNADWDTAPLSKGDFRQYCRDVYGAKVVSVAPHDAYSLRCGSQDIDVTDVCNYTYGDDVRKGYGKDIRLIDRLANMGKRYDGWGCMLDLGVAGDVDQADLENWCADRDFNLINDGDPDAHDGRQYLAYRWFCTNGQGIPMDQLCVEIFGSNTLDRVRNVYDKHSWECRYSKE